MSELQSLVEGLLRQLGPEQLSLLIYAPQDRIGSVNILHAGESPPVAELADVEQAFTLINGGMSSAKAELLPSRTEGGYLICVPNDLTHEGHERRQVSSFLTHCWVGWRGDKPSAAALDLLQSVLPLIAAHHENQFAAQDDLTGLPGRAAFEQVLARILSQRERHMSPIALILFSPLAIDEWNASFGREEADAYLARFAEHLQRAVRRSDQLCRFGGATFALILTDITSGQLEEVAEGIRLRYRAQAAHDDVVSQLGIGAKWVDSQVVCSRHDLVAAADRALRHAKLNPAQHVVLLDQQDIEPQLALDPLEGIFTGNVDDDYRAMRLLWRSVQGVREDIASPELLMRGFANLSEHYGLRSIGCAQRRDERWFLLSAMGAAEDIPWLDWAETASTAEHLVVIQYAGDPLLLMYTPGEPELVFWLLAPTQAMNQPDLNLLSVLLPQLGGAYLRSLAVQQTLRAQQTENDRLHETVERIQHRDGATDFLFESSAMRSLLRQAEAVAATNETVLVTGESGTGKEVIARTLHEMSHLSDQALVIVDCTAIPETLFEAELFGRTKGAYTSADTASEGYIAKAAGGTLFLDEIGELPIDVQSKLLRFLQEKEIRPVGAAVTQHVEVRVIAATNRDLAAEVEAGRFRRDLYHRLCVLHLHIPPLRERHADILTLARHFVTSYGQLHRRRRMLSEPAENALMNNTWAGNVRELQHTLLRAVLLSENEEITPFDLQLEAHQADVNLEQAPAEPEAMRLPGLSEEPRAQLLEALDAVVAACIQNNRPLPLGAWLADDFVELAYISASKVVKHGAEMLGLAETTYRRQIDRVEQDREAGLRVRSDTWVQLVQPLLPPVLQCYRPEGNDSLLKQLKFHLVEIVARQLPHDQKTAASLVGVTPPTYKRHLQAVQDAA